VGIVLGARVVRRDVDGMVGNEVGGREQFGVKDRRSVGVVR
jgi:hypothetical protein